MKFKLGRARGPRSSEGHGACLCASDQIDPVDVVWIVGINFDGCFLFPSSCWHELRLSRVLIAWFKS